MIYLDKSEALFSRNVSEEDKDLICARMGVTTVLNHSKYLGLPEVFGRSKKDIFSIVVDRVWNKIKGWKEWFLSRTDKEVPISTQHLY